MQDYMRALQDRFDTIPPKIGDLEEEVRQTEDELRRRLEPPERKLLLKVIDLENALRDEAALNSFISGYRLACGIHRELTEQVPFSFDREEEEQAREIWMAEEVQNG